MHKHLITMVLLTSCSEPEDTGKAPAEETGTALDTADTGPVKEVDTEGPTIDHTPIEGIQPNGTMVIIEAIVTDESGVGGVELLYRPGTTSLWTTGSMTLWDKKTFLYKGAIDAADVDKEGVEYTIRAMDWAGNESWEPAEGVYGPHAFEVEE